MNTDIKNIYRVFFDNELPWIYVNKNIAKNEIAIYYTLKGEWREYKVEAKKKYLLNNKL